MSAGIQVFNQTGQIQITDSYKNLTFLRKGAITSFNQYHEYSISFSTSEVIAFRVDYGNRFAMDCEGVAISGTTQTFSGATDGNPLYYYVFGWANPTAGKYFEVRNGIGEVTFSDNDAHMKVYDVRFSDSSPVSSDSYPGWGGNSMVIVDNFTFPANKTIAVIPSFSAIDNYYFLMNNFGFCHIAEQFYFKAAGQIIKFYDYFYSWDHGAVNAGHNYLAIDVTGL